MSLIPNKSTYNPLDYHIIVNEKTGEVRKVTFRTEVAAQSYKKDWDLYEWEVIINPRYVTPEK